jgi:hypothetical protein
MKKKAMAQSNVFYACVILAVGTLFHTFFVNTGAMSLRDISIADAIEHYSYNSGTISHSDRNETTLLQKQVTVLEQQLQELKTNQLELKQALIEQLDFLTGKFPELASHSSAVHLRGALQGENGRDMILNDGKNLDDLSELYKRFKYQAPREHLPSDAIDANCGTAPDYATWFAQKMEFHSVNGEDREIYVNFFKDILDGHSPTYVELGAFNGKRESNSRFFDVCLGWNGLLVEANPNTNVWNQLVVNRPTAHRMWMAASCSHEAALHQNASVPFHDVMWTNAAQDKETNNAYTGRRETVDVPCGSLTPFIKDLLGGRVTFFSLDVEGAEPLVLEHVDFDQIQVDVMIVENANSFCGANCESRDKFRAIMARAGYVRPNRQFVKKSDLFVHPKSPFAQLVL